ncbi:TonB-dependent receptor [Donghicola sp. XS_ASV15]
MRTTVLSGMWVTMVAGAGIAQDSTDLGTIELETSRRGIQTDTAASTTVVTDEEIEARQASTLVELLDTTPNVSLVNGSSPQGAAVSIRGLGTYAGTYGTDGKVAVIVDGVSSGAEEIYRNGSMLSLEPELFREVTVTRGPGESFGYASGAMGGTIEAETKDASDFLEGGDAFALRQKIGSESNGEGWLSSTILAFAPDEKFDALVFYGKRSVGDRTDGDGNTLDASGFDAPSALVKLNYHVNDASTLTFGYSYNEIPQSDVPYDVYNPDWSDVLVDRYTKDTTAYLAYRFNPVDNALVNLEARLTYKYEDMELSSDTVSSNLYNTHHSTETRGLRLENEALFATGIVNHTLTTGVEVKERRRASTISTGTYQGDNDSSAPGGTDESYAVYLADRMEIGQRLTLTPQIRFEKQTLTSDNNNDSQTCYGPTYCVTTPAIEDGTSWESEAWTGALSGRYAFSNDLAVFGSVAYNENLPILDDLRNEDNIEQSEKGVTQEVGLSFDRMDAFAGGDTLRFKLTAFQTRIWDGTTYSGIEKVDLSGVEFEASYAHPAFYADFNAAMTRGTINSTDDNFNYAPADTAQLTLGKRLFDDQLDLSFEAKHAWGNDRTSGTSGAVAPSDDWTTYGVAAAYTPNRGALEGFEFRASVENLTDEAYRPYLTDASSYATGRNLKLSIAKTF